MRKIAYASQSASLQEGSTIAYGSDFSPNVPKFSRCITTLRAVPKVTKSYIYVNLMLKSMLKSIKYLPSKNTYVHLLKKPKKTKNYETSAV